MIFFPSFLHEDKQLFPCRSTQGSPIVQAGIKPNDFTREQLNLRFWTPLKTHLSFKNTPVIVGLWWLKQCSPITIGRPSRECRVGITCKTQMALPLFTFILKRHTTVAELPTVSRVSQLVRQHFPALPQQGIDSAKELLWLRLWIALAGLNWNANTTGRWEWNHRW